jgi:general stress protein YciG
MEPTQTNEQQVTEEKPKLRGFARIDPSKVKEIARKGGKASQASGKAHRFTTEEAKAAGQKGGKAPRVRREGVTR